jgi:hypothetical protein
MKNMCGINELNLDIHIEIPEIIMNQKALDTILEGLLIPYKERVPAVGKVLEGMIQEGIIKNEKEIDNDHIAFRTLGVPHLGVKSFEKIFLHYGYQKRDYFHFEGKKLDAWWYSPPTENYPRIFISELRVEDLSKESARIIHSYTNGILEDPVNQINLNKPEDVVSFLNSPLWHLPTLEDYNFLANESEYAAWVIYNRYYLNHYTISVHALKNGFNTLEAFNQFLEKLGITLNTAGGKIKTSGDGLLSQSSTMADMVLATFKDRETKLIPGSYVEFAHRKPLPDFVNWPENKLTRKELRDGFETSNADKIFESTFTKKL